MSHIDRRIFAVIIAVFASALNAHALPSLEAARQFQREVEVAPSTELFDGPLPRPRDEVALPIGKVFDQGHTQWCWAFSAYHTLRTYYLNAQNVNGDWKSAVGDLDQQSTLKSFLGRHVSQGQTGEPARFVRMLGSDKSLGEDAWTPFMPTDGRWLEDDDGRAPDIDMSAVKRLARGEIVGKILTTLRKGSPAAYCADPHCITIYGAKIENGKATEYYIADSLGGRTYHADARRMNQRLEYILTRDW